jgi:hypothetical protein
VAERPAYYAAGEGRWRDWWTVLHPPYTAWHLAYVVIGASLAPHVDVVRLLATLVAFLFAVGIAAHTLDELHGRPLRTKLADATLIAASAAGLAIALAIGVVGVARAGVILLPFLVVGPALVVGYDLELFGGAIHTDLGFALAWGAFPVLTAYAAQAERLDAAAVLGAVAAVLLSLAQRSLSTPARLLRRHVEHVDATLALDNGSLQPLDRRALLAPLEHALRATSWAVVALAAALAVARLT